MILNNELAYASGNQIYKMTNGSLATAEGDTAVKELKVEIAPNPVTDVLNLKIHYEHQDHVKVALYDVSGKFLGYLLKDDIAVKGLKNYQIPFKYPAGNYFLSVHSNLGRQSIKFTKK